MYSLSVVNCCNSGHTELLCQTIEWTVLGKHMRESGLHVKYPNKKDQMCVQGGLLLYAYDYFALILIIEDASWSELVSVAQGAHTPMYIRQLCHIAACQGVYSS